MKALGVSNTVCYGIVMVTRRSTLLGLCSCLVGPLHAAGAEPTADVVALAPLPDALIELEMQRLQDALSEEVPHVVPRTPASDAAWIALARAETEGAEMMIDRPQLLVVVDRNPQMQQLAIVLARPDGEWQTLGGTKVSTGSIGRFDHYITPRGVFRLTDAVLGYRAEGTLNENGIRGLGAKGMRVWDFGWQVAMKGWNAGPGKPDRIPIRLMMHATDPARLEQRIGRPASQGCIRIPSAMNRFLDRHGVLDAEYERAAVTEVRFRALLLPGREPSLLAGNTLVVVDSGEPDATSATVASGTAGPLLSPVSPPTMESQTPTPFP